MELAPKPFDKLRANGLNQCFPKLLSRFAGAFNQLDSGLCRNDGFFKLTIRVNRQLKILIGLNEKNAAMHILLTPLREEAHG